MARLVGTDVPAATVVNASRRDRRRAWYAWIGHGIRFCGQALRQLSRSGPALIGLCAVVGIVASLFVEPHSRVSRAVTWGPTEAMKRDRDFENVRSLASHGDLPAPLTKRIISSANAHYCPELRDELDTMHRDVASSSTVPALDLLIHQLCE